MRTISVTVYKTRQSTGFATTMFGMQGDATALPASSPKSEGSGYYDNPYDYIPY